MKGMAVRGRPGVWDYERYTRLYNKIYTAVKKVRPDALIGGFYKVIPGDGTAEILGSSGRNTWMPLDDKDTRYGIAYFLTHAIHVDFFCIDRNVISSSNPNRGSYTDTQAMKLTHVYDTATSRIIDAVAKFPKYKDIPVMYSEYYGNLSGHINTKKGDTGRVTGGADVEQYAAAHYASIYNHVIKGSGGAEIWMLFWMEAEEDIPLNSIFTATNNASGGQPKPNYWVMKAFKDWFNHTELVHTTSSSPDVEVIASAEAAMVINKRNTMVKFNVNGQGTTLPAYGVALLDLAIHHPQM